MDIDLLIDLCPDNEAKVYAALANLPDQAVLELTPGEVARYTVVRVADEIVVDLLGKAGGIDYSEAAPEIAFHEVEGVRIPFASPRLLWRMKRSTYRDKDVADVHFLRALLTRMGEPLE